MEQENPLLAKFEQVGDQISALYSGMLFSFLENEQNGFTIPCLKNKTPAHTVAKIARCNISFAKHALSKMKITGLISLDKNGGIFSQHVLDSITHVRKTMK